ncbi:NAD-dependent protein deacetylase [Thermovenabulum gondwanense]|uniref:protein acetyllysine N-acetyltransferase n=2 Tax=Thermovenabulum gondwanense TaxID=520767 RepID=A0A162MJQ1_9FIRM|nr:NAD-dependent protein deacetylase [Thermovenabulum gondwanense]
MIQNLQCFNEKIEALKELLTENKKNNVLTGAGISTESGIPDYRSKGTGLWERFDPMKYVSVTALMTDPKKFFDFNIPTWTKYVNAQPNIAHKVIAKLEEMGYIQTVITQNIDGLHIKAGSKRVREVHGHLRTCHCIECKKTFPFEEMSGQYFSGINPPKCSNCGGMLRPDVVLFEDPMGKDYLKALEDMEGCELLVVVGSSLQVYPVADLPSFSKKLVIINKEETPWDRYADLVIHESIGEVFRHLAEIMYINVN